MNIKKATNREEKQAVFNIRQTVFIEEQKVPADIEVDEYEQMAIHFICYVDDKPVGTSRLRFISEHGKMERIAVLKDYRDQAIGSNLIKAMEEEIASRYVSYSKVNAQPQNTGFYESSGYQVTSEEFMVGDMPHVTMTKTLNE